MAEEVAEQLKFPETDSNVVTPEKPLSTGIIPVDEGAGLYTGAYGDPRTHMAKVPEGATGRIIKTKTNDRVTSAQIEFESPPELQGKRYWVERRRKGPGFI